MSRPKFLINGEYTKQVSVQDRGFHYGDGLFETIAVYRGQPLLWSQHMQRLQKGCIALGFPELDCEQLKTEAKQICSSPDKSILKIILSCGEGGRAYSRPLEVNPSRILAEYDWPEYKVDLRKNGVELRVCDTPVSNNHKLAGIKHLNRLEQVLARNEWQDESIFEGLMLDNKGHVIEGTMSNLFIVIDNTLITPDLTFSGIKGIIRNRVLDLAEQHGLEAVIKSLTMEDVCAADEVFISNSIIGIVPVKKIIQQAYTSFKYAHRINESLLAKNAIAPI